MSDIQILVSIIAALLTLLFGYWKLRLDEKKIKIETNQQQDNSFHEIVSRLNQGSSETSFADFIRLIEIVKNKKEYRKESVNFICRLVRNEFELETKKSDVSFLQQAMDAIVEIIKIDPESKNYEANLSKVLFRDISLEKYNLSNTNFSESKFVNCNLLGTVFDASNMKNCIFTDCEFSYPQETSLYNNKKEMLKDEFSLNLEQHVTELVATFRRCNLENANFSSAHLAYVNFQRSHLDSAIFINCNLRYAVLRGTSLCKCKFDGSNMGTSILDAADCRYCSFFGADLWGASMFKVRLLFTNFKNCNLSSTEYLDKPEFLQLALYDDSTILPW